MIPTRENALELVQDGLASNPGPWGRHCLTAAHCAEKIARACGDMDPEKAYIFGLLHDIGRKFGVRHLGHVSDGYSYMMKLGYDELAKICLTHSFNNHTVDEYIGKFDTSDEELELIKTELAKVTYDEYDWLIQLCDSLAGAEGVLDIEERMADVKARYGSYPQQKWDANIRLMRYFEEKMGQDIYTVCEKDSFVPECVDIQIMKNGDKYWNATADFALNCSWRAGGYLAELMKEDRFEDNERVLVAMVDGNIAGFCTYANKDELPEKYDVTPFIGFMFVDEKYRGKRLSEKLIQAACNHAAKEGVSKLYIMSGEIGLYEKYGFEFLGMYETIYGTEDQLFVKEIRVGD